MFMLILGYLVVIQAVSPTIGYLVDLTIGPDGGKCVRCAMREHVFDAIAVGQKMYEAEVRG